MNVYDFNAVDIDGNLVEMSDYRGKVLLIVNTASKCGFTPQFEDLQFLNKHYKAKGLVVLGFPCNQFAEQDSGTNEEIKQFCVVNYGVNFTMFQKIEVNGENAHPLFKFLRKETGGFLNDKIKWNFTKFLVDRNGNVVRRYAPNVKPKKFISDIEVLLNS